MNKPMIQIHDTETNTIINREMNDIEYNHFIDIENQIMLEKQKVEETTAKRQTLLNKLGITEEEAKLLLS
jgi:hypothetical protein